MTRPLRQRRGPLDWLTRRMHIALLRWLNKADINHVRNCRRDGVMTERDIDFLRKTISTREIRIILLENGS